MATNLKVLLSQGELRNKRKVLMCHLLKLVISVGCKIHAEDKVKDTQTGRVINVDILQVGTALPVILLALLCRCREAKPLEATDAENLP